MRSRIVVANPGGQSHLREYAEALAEEGALDTYISTFGFAPTDIARVEKLRPRAFANRLALELRRRGVPEIVGDKARRAATFLELVNVLLNRAPLPERFRFAAFRTTRRAFDRAAARAVDAATDAVIGYQGAATTTFRRARSLGVATVLDYPIAHYEITERVLEEEARLVPEYAPTLRVRSYPEWIRRRYAEEIATADRIIMVSEHHQSTFEDAGVTPERMFIVPWYIDAELFSPGEGSGEDGIFRVAFLGQITQRKGISYLIEGFRRAALDSAELVLIGMPVGARPWAEVPGVRHIPPMPRFMLPETLRTCHAIALPSLIEGFPISVLEGMACGLPAIISENIGHDFVEDGVNGWVVPIRDPDAIAERLRTLHADTELRRRMSAASRSTAEGFTRQRNHDALRDGIEQLLAERPGPLPAASTQRA